MKYDIIVINVSESSEREKDDLIKFIRDNSSRIDYISCNYVIFIKDQNGNMNAYEIDEDEITYLRETNKYNIKVINGITSYFRYIKIKKLKF